MKPELEARFLTARRAVIARRFSGLNEMQRRAVMTTQGPLLLLAGAGSGNRAYQPHREPHRVRRGVGFE